MILVRRVADLLWDEMEFCCPGASLWRGFTEEEAYLTYGLPRRTMLIKYVHSTICDTARCQNRYLAVLLPFAFSDLYMHSP